MNVDAETEPLTSVDQKRANDALRCIDEIRKVSAESGYYAGEAHKLPVRIMASGLGQALAFLVAKTSAKPPRGPAIERLVEDLSRRIIGYLELAKARETVEKDTLIRILVEEDVDTLRRATDEALAWLKWLNRFAESYDLKKDE